MKNSSVLVCAVIDASPNIRKEATAQYTGFRIRAAQIKRTIRISNNLYMGYQKKSNQKKIILTCGNSEKKSSIVKKMYELNINAVDFM